MSEHTSALAPLVPKYAEHLVKEAVEEIPAVSGSRAMILLRRTQRQGRGFLPQ